MPDPKLRRVSLAVLVVMIVVLAGFAVAIYNAAAPGLVQARHMREVDRFLPTLQPAVSADPRFKLVELRSYVGSDGSLIVHGEVGSDADLAALRELVGRFECPRPVEWRVEVIAPEWRAKRDEPDPPPANQPH